MKRGLKLRFRTFFNHFLGQFSNEKTEVKFVKKKLQINVRVAN